MPESVSISSIRKLVENRSFNIGCFSLLFIAFAASFVAQGVQCQQRTFLDQDQVIGTPVAQVGNYTATAQSIDRMVEMQRGNQTEPGSWEPATEASTYGSAINRALDEGFTMILAKQNGVMATPDNAEDAIPSLYAQFYQQTKSDILMQGNLKETATDAEFAKEYERLTGGKQLTQEAFADDLKLALQDPSRREAMLAQISQKNLLEKYAATVKVSDEDLQKAYSNLTLKQISLQGKTGEAGMAEARKVLDELKSGRTFEDLMVKYNPKTPNSKGANETTEFPAQFVQLIPAYKPLLNLKVGDVSEPIDLPSGVTIYKLVGVKPSLPADFQKNKEKLKQDLLRQTASAKMMEDLDNVRKSAQVTWKSPSYQALYEYSQLSNDTKLSAAEKNQKLKDIQARAMAAMDTDPAGGRVAALAVYAANSALWDAASASEKKSMTEERIKAIEAVLNASESPKLRIDLAGLYMDAGKTPEAVNQLLSAATNNSDTSAYGQGIYNNLLAKIEEFKAANKLNANDLKSIQTELDRWKKDKVERDRLEAEQKKRDAQMQKDAQKAAEAAKASASKTSSTPAARK